MVSGEMDRLRALVHLETAAITASLSLEWRPLTYGQTLANASQSSNVHPEEQMLIADRYISSPSQMNEARAKISTATESSKFAMSYILYVYCSTLTAKLVGV